MKNSFQVVFEDEDLIVLEKPSGLLSQAGPQGVSTDLTSLLKARWQSDYVGLVHRLDRNTSGLMVLARNSAAARELSKQLQAGTLHRGYQALHWGSLAQKFSWKHWLRRDEVKLRTQAFRQETEGAKTAILHGQCLKNFELPKGKIVSLSEIVLETGRTHQIRAQSAREGFPLVGDRKYGRPSDSFDRLALHSSSLEFVHPQTGAKMHFKSSFPLELIEEVLA